MKSGVVESMPRTMKDSERIILIMKVFLDLKGPSTAQEIAEYVEECPVGIQKVVSSHTISSLVKGNHAFRSRRVGKQKALVYSNKE